MSKRHIKLVKIAQTRNRPPIRLTRTRALPHMPHFSTVETSVKRRYKRSKKPSPRSKKRNETSKFCWLLVAPVMVVLLMNGPCGPCSSASFAASSMTLQPQPSVAAAPSILTQLRPSGTLLHAGSDALCCRGSWTPSVASATCKAAASVAVATLWGLVLPQFARISPLRTFLRSLESGSEGAPGAATATTPIALRIFFLRATLIDRSGSLLSARHCCVTDADRA